MVNRGEASTFWHQRLQLVAKLEPSHTGGIINTPAKAGVTGIIGLPFVPTVLGVIDSTEIDHLLKLESFAIAKSRRHFLQIVCRQLDAYLAIGQCYRFQLFPELCAQGVYQLLFTIRHDQRAMVLVRLILFCNCKIPYNRASAVGGQPGT